MTGKTLGVCVLEYLHHSHREGWALLNMPEYQSELTDIDWCIRSISDADLMAKYWNTHYRWANKSLAPVLNELLRERFGARGWEYESAIFQDPEYAQKRETVWRLDFAKGTVSVEVSYNHGEALAWNLMKPVLASELNHVEKAVQTKLGVIILATQSLKKAGGFDGATGTWEKAIRYLKPMQNQLSVPLVLIGIQPPRSFVMDHYINSESKKRARLKSTAFPYDFIEP